MRANDLIVARFASLSPRLQQAARFVVDHPNEVVITSMRQIAERAGAQPATLVRLAQQLGYAGWPELKAAFAKDLGLSADDYTPRPERAADARRTKGGDRLAALFSAQRRNLELTEAQCARSLREAVEVLQRAKAVHVAGFRVSFPAAYALFYGYRMFRNSVHLIDGQSGGLGMQLRAIERDDAVVSITIAPYSREALTVVEAAKEVGAHIIAVSDSITSPLALMADVPVQFLTRGPGTFSSATPALALVEVLLELLVADAGQAVANKIDRAQRRLFESGANLQPTAGRPSAGKS
ncbi:MAG: MurR/RpiR family transcriptional regulator [Burkholderiales bacterium]